MLIAQSLANLLNGVSQRPQEQRHSSQADVQKNGFSHLVRGLMKRPPLVHIGKLTSTITGWSTAFFFSINRDSSERYHVAVVNGDVLIYDALTLTPVTVVAPKGKAYLTDAAGKGFRAATAGDTTIIVNRGVVSQRGTTKTAAAKYEALLYIRQADYGTIYEVLLNDVPVGIQTVAGDTANQRVQISTEKIATDLFNALKAEPLLSGFTFTQFGSTIYCTRADGKDFKVSTFDGLADQGLKAVKGSVQDFADLPRKAPTGFTVEVAGDPTSALDNYWVMFDDQGSPEQDGIWREAPKPGTIINFAELTMPHRLVRNGHVLQNQPHVSPTAAGLIVVDVGTAGVVTTPWAFTTPDNTAIPAGTSPVIRDHTHGAKFTIPSAKQRIAFTYLLDTSLMDVGTTALVEVYKNGTLISGAQQFTKGGTGLMFSQAAGPLLADQTGGMSLGDILPRPRIGAGAFDLTAAFATNDVVEVRLSYSTGVTPDQYRRAYLTPSVISMISTGFREIRLADTDLYPVGAVINLTIDGQAFTYTVITTPKTGSQIATALQPTIDANANLICIIGSVGWGLKVSNTSNTYPAVTVASVTFDETKTFFNPALAMVTNEHVGRTLRNLTDNSSGVVTANDATTVTLVSALTGGTNNVFKPGDTISIDGTGRYFVFEPCPWDLRNAGDTTIVPFPSFIDNTISDVTFYQDRLGFCSGEKIVFSSSGDLFNFFRYSATQLLSNDMIDVQAAQRDVALFHSLVLWNEGLYAISDNGEFSISGEPALTPTTIRIDLVSRIPNSPGPRPVVNGNLLYMTRAKGGYTQVSEFYQTGINSATGLTVESDDVTQDSPKYVKGTPIALVGDDTLGFIGVVTDDNGGTYLHAYSYHDDANGNRVQSSWSRWEFASGQIVGLDMVDGKLGVITVRADGVFLASIDLNVALDTPTTDEGLLYLDRRVDQTTTGVSSAFAVATTTWTLPFNVATNGSEGTLVIVNRTTGLVLASTRPAANQIAVTGQGNLTAASVYIGVLYEFRYKLSRIYYRLQQEVPETGGFLMLRWLTAFYHDTTYFDVVVTLLGRAARTYTTSVAALGLPVSGKVRLPIQSVNDNATIELVNFTPGVCAFSGLDWEGDFAMRSRRV